MEKIVEYIKENKCEKIIVMLGSGASVSAGIPDFRSPETGIYKKYDLPNVESIFDLDFFKSNQKPFYAFAKDILFNKDYQPTKVHHFIKMLEEKNVLLRCYTQNIDGLEYKVGISPSKIVAAHGNFESATVITGPNINQKVPIQEVIDSIDNLDELTEKYKGIVKPNIVFFKENLPMNFFAKANEDFPRADLLIVIGTSLKVNPFAELINKVYYRCPRLLINLEELKDSYGLPIFRSERDYSYIGFADKGVEELANLLGWKIPEANIDNLKESIKESIKELDIVIFKLDKCPWCEKFLKEIEELKIEDFFNIITIDETNKKDNPINIFPTFFSKTLSKSLSGYTPVKQLIENFNDKDCSKFNYN